MGEIRVVEQLTAGAVTIIASRDITMSDVIEWVEWRVQCLSI